MQFKEMQKKTEEYLHNFYFEFVNIWYSLDLTRITRNYEFGDWGIEELKKCSQPNLDKSEPKSYANMMGFE